MNRKIPKITLDEIKKRLMKQYNVSSFRSFSSPHQYQETTDEEPDFSNIISEIQNFMLEHPYEIEKISESVGKGEDFRAYFLDKESLKKLLEMRKTDVESFYRILKKEELFINYILRSMEGYERVIVSFGPEYVQELYDNFDEDEDDDNDCIDV